MKYLIGHLDGYDAGFLSENDQCYDYFLPILNQGLDPQTLEERDSFDFLQENFTF